MVETSQMSETLALSVAIMVYGAITWMVAMYILGAKVGGTDQLDEPWKALRAALVLGLTWPILVTWYLINDP